MTMTRLLEWFGRPRSKTTRTELEAEEDISPILGPPVLVTKEVAETAKASLRQHSGIDFDAFHREATANSLFSERLGPTLDCLTMQEVSESVFSRSGVGFLDLDHRLIKRLTVHLSVCQDCWEAIELYRQVERQSAVRLSRAGINIRDAFWFGGEGTLCTGRNHSRYLEIPVFMEPNNVVVPTSLSVAYPFVRKGLSLHRTEIGRLQERGHEYTKLLFRSDPLPELAAMKPGTCGFIELASMNKNQPIYSVGPIRLLDRPFSDP